MYKICIVNRSYPPNPAGAGNFACDMAEYIIKNHPELKVTIVYVDAPYFGGGSCKKPIGDLVGISAIYKGRNKIKRFIGSIIEGYRLIKKALREADIIITMTDPPLLNLFAGKLCKKKNIPWIYWSLDIYPHAFKAAGLVSEKNFFYRYFEKSFNNNIPSLLIALGEQQADFIQQKWVEKIPQVILPCGIQNEETNHELPFWKMNDNKIYFAYAGNCGEAHDSHFIIDFVNCLDERVHKCILALYGANSQNVLNEIKNHPAIEIVKTIDLSYIDVHLVSLLPEWTHICVPSKAVSAICAEQTILFNGLETSDTWQMFNSAGWIIDEFNNRQKRISEIKSVLLQISDPDLLRAKKDNAKRLKRELLSKKAETYMLIVDRIKNFVSQ